MEPEVIHYSAEYGVDSFPMSGASAGLFGAMFVFWMLFVVTIYVYMAFCLMKIANKTNTPNAWFAWVPILNVVLMIQIAKKPMWWLALFLLAFIPFVGPIAVMVIAVIIWMEIAAAVGKEKWLGILMIVPIANLIIPGYLAFSETTTASTASSQPTKPAKQPSTPKVEKKTEKKEPVDTGIDIDMD